MENGMSCYYECMRYKNNIEQQVVNKSRHTTCVAERKPKQDIFHIIFQIIPQISSEIPVLSNEYTQKEPIVKVTSIWHTNIKPKYQKPVETVWKFHTLYQVHDVTFKYVYYLSQYTQGNPGATCHEIKGPFPVWWYCSLFSLRRKIIKTTVWLQNRIAFVEDNETEYFCIISRAVTFSLYLWALISK